MNPQPKNHRPAAVDARAARATGNHLVAQNDEREPLFGCVLSHPRPTLFDVALREAVAPRRTHTLDRERGGGSGLDGWAQPICSCGWKGRREYAHDDYQHTNLQEQEQAHLRGAR